MSREIPGFKATFADDKPFAAHMASEDDALNAEFENRQEIVRTSYNFGDGLNYDYETNTLSADKTDVVEAGSDKMVTSGAVAAEIRNAGVSYLSDEHIVGKWNDGKTLYERTITVTDVTIHNVRDRSFSHGIENVDTMIIPEAYLRDNAVTRANGNFINATSGVVFGNNAVMLQWVADDTYIWINSGSFFNASENRTWKIVARYTKVGDE